MKLINMRSISHTMYYIFLLVASTLWTIANEPLLPSNVHFHVNLPPMSQIQTTNTQTQPITTVDCGINNRPVIQTKSESSAKNNTETHTNIQVSTIVTLSAILKSSQSIFNSLKQKYHTTSQQGISLWHTHKYKSIPLFLMSAYIILFSRILYDNYYISNTNRWGNWRLEQTPIELYTYNATDLTHQLLVDIQTRYMIKNDPTNFVMPLISFLQEIDQEEKILKRYLMYTAFINKPLIRYIFPSTQSAKVSQMRERLQLIRTLFMKWMAKQNIIHHSK